MVTSMTAARLVIIYQLIYNGNLTLHIAVEYAHSGNFGSCILATGAHGA